MLHLSKISIHINNKINNNWQILANLTIFKITMNQLNQVEQ